MNAAFRLQPNTSLQQLTYSSRVSAPTSWLRQALGLFMFLLFGLCGSAQDVSDSLEAAFETETNWDQKAEIAYSYCRLNLGRNPQRCMDLYSQVEEHMDELQDSSHLFHLYAAKGIIYKYRGVIDTARWYCTQSLELAQSLNDSSLMVRAMSNLAVIYRHTAEYEKALDFYQATLSFYTSSGDSANMGNMKAEIGNLYYSLKNWQVGDRYQHEALALFKALNYWRGVGNVYTAISAGFDMQGQLDSAIVYSEKSVTAHELSGDIYGQINAKRALCSYFGDLDRPVEDRLACHQELLQLDLENGIYEGLMLDYLNIGNSQIEMKQYQEGLANILRSLSMARELEDDRIRMDCYRSLAAYYSSVKGYKMAFLYNDSSFALQDSIRGNEIQATILDLDQKYQTAEKERALLEEQAKSTVLEKKSTEAELKVSNRNKWIFGLGGMSLALVFLGLLLIQSNKRKAQKEKDLALLKERDNSLKAVIDAQEEERKRIAKDLHDGIGQQLSGLKMAWQKLSSDLHPAAATEKDRILGLSQILSESAAEVRSISHRMMPKALQELGLLPAMEDMLEKTFHYSNITYRLDHHRVDQRFDEAIEISLYRICQELINNCIKYAEATEISVQLMANAQRITLLVEDNGKGFDAEKATQGHGLMNIASRLRTIDGQIAFAPGPNKGTVASVRIPLQTTSA